MAKIVFIQTGGTIDKDYPKKVLGYAFEFGEPATKRILERLNPSFTYDIVTACQKDSTELTDADRQEIVSIIRQSSETKFLITHGTDTMNATASYIADRIQGDKLVVITGSMLPERFVNTDAAINVGCAIGAVNVLISGVYIAMHGIVKHHLDMKRNQETGQYY